MVTEKTPPTQARIVLELSVPDALEVLNGLSMRRSHIAGFLERAVLTGLDTTELAKVERQIVAIDSRIRGVVFGPSSRPIPDGCICQRCADRGQECDYAAEPGEDECGSCKRGRHAMDRERAPDELEMRALWGDK